MVKNPRTEGYPTANKGSLRDLGGGFAPTGGGSLRDPSLSPPRTALKKGTTSLRSVVKKS